MTTEITVAASGGDYTTVKAAYESATRTSATAAGTPVDIIVKPGTYATASFGTLDGDTASGGTASAPIRIIADRLVGTPGAVIIATSSYAFNITHGVGYVSIEGFDCTSSTPGTIGLGGGCVNLSSSPNTTTGRLNHHITLSGINAYNYYDTAQLNHGFLLNGEDIDCYGLRASRNGQHGCYVANVKRLLLKGCDFSFNGGRCSAVTASQGSGLRLEGDDITVDGIALIGNKVDGFGQWVDSPYTSRRLKFVGDIICRRNGRHGFFFQGGGTGEKPKGLNFDFTRLDLGDNGKDTVNFDSSTYLKTPQNFTFDATYVHQDW